MAVWDQFLTENDRKVLAARKPRAKRGFGEKPALLVIDMQVTACGDDRPIYEQLDRYPGACGPYAWEAIRHMQKLLPAARAAGVPVIYTKHVFRPTSGLPQAAPESNFSSLNPLSEIPEEIAMQEGDLLLEKQVASVFFHTGLIYMLLNLKVDTLLVVGNSTSGCVRASVVDAGGYRFNVAVIEECVFDRIEMSHAASLFDIQFKYADVVNLPEVYDYLSQIGARQLATATGD
jgi:nicotinamidase-related amidase